MKKKYRKKQSKKESQKEKTFTQKNLLKKEYKNSQKQPKTGILLVSVSVSRSWSFKISLLLVAGSWVGDFTVGSGFDPSVCKLLDSKSLSCIGDKGPVGLKCPVPVSINSPFGGDPLKGKKKKIN